MINTGSLWTGWVLKKNRVENRVGTQKQGETRVETRVSSILIFQSTTLCNDKQGVKGRFLVLLLSSMNLFILE